MSFITGDYKSNMVSKEINLKIKQLESEYDEKIILITDYLNEAIKDKLKSDWTKNPKNPKYGMIDDHLNDLNNRLDFLHKFYTIIQHVNHHKIDKLEYYVKLLDTMLELGA